MLSPVHKTRIVPTHLGTPETVLSFGGLSLSARQFLLLLIGAALSYDAWKYLGFLISLPAGSVLATAGALLPVLLACAFAFGQIAGRDLASWALTLVRYLTRPRCLVWRSVRFLEPAKDSESVGTEESEQAHA
jgi:hypothetical protein